VNTNHSERIQELSKSLLWPLNLFCAHYSRELPDLTPLFEQHMPEPYKQLLVHKRNMTPTLESYHNGTIHIERINVMPGDEETTREVVLRMDEDEEAVEYGASRVFLRTLPKEAVRLIEEGKIPLGTLLRTCQCRHTAQPSGYFKIRPTPFFAGIFDTTGVSHLFGRRNSLVALDGNTIAEVCEILPPENSSDRLIGR
jgi:chorismate-pyruvate lyase